MNFASFCRAHGLVLDYPAPDGRWHRVPTTSHPKKRNGAYRYAGTHGHVQDHASMLEPQLWTPDESELAKIDHVAIARVAAQAAQQIRDDQAKAARNAVDILQRTIIDKHPYFDAKGFPDELGPVFTDDKGRRKLCIPMRADGRIVGLQTISDQPAHTINGKDVPAFEKRFLYGQRLDQCVNTMDNHGPKFYCEGFATALSVRAALTAIKTRYTVIVCFTAGNMLKVAKNHGEGIVIADNDMPSQQVPHAGGMGLKVAQDIGLPFWISDREKEDFNDHAQRVGLFRSSQSLKAVLMKRRTT